MFLDTGVCDVNKQNKAGYTAIMLASLAQITDPHALQVIRKLFMNGDVNVRASQVSAGPRGLLLFSYKEMIKKCFVIMNIHLKRILHMKKRKMD